MLKRLIKGFGGQSHATKILIYSPDTDTYNIGLGLISDTTNKEYIIPCIHVKKVLMFKSSAHSTADLAPLPSDKISKTMQSLFISTGWDFIFFKSLGNFTN